MEGTLADMQHHDAITGTSTMRVTNDYLEKISHSMEETYQVYSKLIDHFMKINLV